MSFSVGIVGLPNVGKSTLFKALTKKRVDIASHPFTTINPNVGVVSVPDKRLDKISEIIKPEKVTPTSIEFVDIAGLVKGAHKGEGLGNQFLAHIRNCDAVLEVARAFSNLEVENVFGEINPKKEIEVIKIELLMKDLETSENAIKKLEKDAKSQNKTVLKKMSILKKLKDALSNGKLILEINLTEEEKSEITEYQFLTAKPKVMVLNTDKKDIIQYDGSFILLNFKLEEEISELNPTELKELEISSGLDPVEKFRHDSLPENKISRSESKFLSGVDRLILNCYNVLDLITFYTIAGGRETRALTLKKGSSVKDAAGKLHSDFEEKFIKAEVIGWKVLVETGSHPGGQGSPVAAWQKAKELGIIKTVGKDYVVQDGDVIEFKI